MKELQTSFHSLKMALICGPVLKGPDFDQPFLLFTDASDLRIGAVLSQQTADGSDHPVAYFSKQLPPRQTRYAVVEKECLAVVKAIQHFKIYLAGVRFRIYTDHACLRFIQEIGDANGRLARWSIFLQQYDFEIVHRPGTTHGNADGLSRQNCNDPPTPTSSARGGGGVEVLPPQTNPS